MPLNLAKRGGFGDGGADGLEALASAKGQPFLYTEFSDSSLLYAEDQL